MNPADLYDGLAATYDEMYATPEDYHEDGVVQELLWPLVEESYSVFDVGCGTGLLLDLHGPRIDPAGYYGVDISVKMIDRFRRKHLDYPALDGDIEDEFVKECVRNRFDYGYDLLVGMYGSPTYLQTETIEWLLGGCRTALLMFTQPGYVPRIHDGPVPTAEAARTAALMHPTLDRIEVVGEHVVTIHRPTS